MERTFSVQRGATRVVFGAGSSKRIRDYVTPLSLQRVLVVSTPGRRADAESLATSLGGASFAGAREHVPVATVEEARAALEREKADGVLAFGGGSAIGLAKALARTAPVRVIAVPTTYSGSEMTAVYGITEGGEKRTGRDERVRPSLVVYDPQLIAALPHEVAIASLWNAMAHAVEALWVDADRATERVAEEALAMLSSSLRRLIVSQDESARTEALEGAYLAGVSFSDAGAGLHHKLCHVLGGAFGLPHAATHAAMLPHVAKAMRASSPRAMAAIARALSVVDPIAGLDALSRASGVTRTLAALGMPRDGIDRVIDAVAPSTKLDRNALRALLEGAFADVARDAPAVRAPATLETMAGALGAHESEALPGALPKSQNTPRPAPHGLYPELVNLTPFTTRRTDNLRLWLYRIRPSFSHGPLVQLPSARFATELGDVEPNRTRWRALDLPTHPTDFLDGLVTLGGSGEPTGGPGFAVHLYAASADMADRCFANVDGDVLIVPQTGTLDVRTELGWLRATPGSALMIPRGIKFTVGLPEGAARGWMLEVFGTRLKLPERGPLGSNGLVDARHLRAPVASFEDRLCPNGYQFVTKVGGKLYAAQQDHSPFDVVAWHGTHA
ncbi:MAG: iron-containing alcohol dehydrogenase, partial [Polyangiales bacterium]